MNVAVRRSVVIACVTIVAVVLLIVLVPSVSAGGSGVLNACVNSGNGMMRLVDSSAACHANESFVEWNIEGPQGRKGHKVCRARRVHKDRKALREPPQVDRHSCGCARPQISRILPAARGLTSMCSTVVRPS